MNYNWKVSLHHFERQSFVRRRVEASTYTEAITAAIRRPLPGGPDGWEIVEVLRGTPVKS